MSDLRRRLFLQGLGSTLPILKLIVDGGHAAGQITGVPPGEASRSSSGHTRSKKFTPIDLGEYFNASANDFGPRTRAKEIGGESLLDGLLRTPAGEQQLLGIPFLLGPAGIQKKSWLAFSTRGSHWTAPSLDIPVHQEASFICLAQFCDWDRNETPPPGRDVIERVGESLAEAVLVYGDGKEQRLAIRRRFEVHSPSDVWGRFCFAALPHRQDIPRQLTDPLRDATMWGRLQIGTCTHWLARKSGCPDNDHLATLWICALANPEPKRVLKALRLRATTDELWVVCGLTLYHGRDNPLRYERVSLYRLTLPEPTDDKGRWKVSVDLGVVARSYLANDFQPETWLLAPDGSLGERTSLDGRQLFAEVAASSDATLTLFDTKNGNRYEFPLREVVAGSQLEAKPGRALVEVLEREKVWLHGRVVDSATDRPTPVRLAFRSKNGRYIPPYGHRRDINTGVFQDYGADLKLMDSSFAYLDGTFQVELPVGDIYVEVSKGFEYQPIRKRLTIQPGQRELTLEIARFIDLRSRGWVSADTHVHFLSPSTAVLEGQAEGLNLINLLALQAGELFSNVGDISQGPLASRDGEMIVWPGTENRQHILGHLGLLGGHGAPVYPMSAGGPDESVIGDPLWTTLADWADACRKREGLAVAAHFPYPVGEQAADIVLGKIDAVEIHPVVESFNDLAHLEWYHYLNCGYRLPVVGGTDKMHAAQPVGGNRTYAYLGKEEFNISGWAAAVRKGNTFQTSGPLLLFHVEGRMPGEEIRLGRSGGTVEVYAQAESFAPIHRLEIVLNGRVVASREEPGGARKMTLKEHVSASGPGWLAARCTANKTYGLYALTAHTSPIYLIVPGQELFSAATATYLLTLIEGGQTWVENLAIRPDQERFERVRKIFVDARAELHRRLHAHGVKH